MSHHPFPWREPFLQALQDYPVVQHACDTVGILRCTAYRAKKADKAFSDAWDEAMEAGIDRAEKEAMRRGVHGWEEPVIDKGRLAYCVERRVDEDGKVTFEPVLDANGQPVPLTIRKHSDMLLALVLKARRATYRVERTEVTSPDGSMSPKPVVVVSGVPRALEGTESALGDEQTEGELPTPPEDFSSLA